MAANQTSCHQDLPIGEESSERYEYIPAIFRRFGVEIADRTMCGWIRQSAELLGPLYGRLKQFVLSSKVVGTDDTR